MIRLAWNLSLRIHALLRWAPSNLLLAATRTPRGLNWGWALSFLAPILWAGAALCFALHQQGGPDWLLLPGLLLFWDGFKFFWAGPINLILLIRRVLARKAAARRARRAERANSADRAEQHA
jgi:hypothetical protein